MASEYKVKQRTIRNDFAPSHPIERIKRHHMTLAGGRFNIKKSRYLFLTSTFKIQNSEPPVVLQMPKYTGLKKKLGKNGSKTHPLNVDTEYENTTTDPKNP